MSETTPILSTQNAEHEENALTDRAVRHRRSTGGSLSSSLRQSLQSMVDVTFSLQGKSASIHDFSGRATVASEIATMSKNLIGGGVLSLSGGIALCSDDPSALIPASLWLILFGAVFGYYCWLIGKLCKFTGQVTYSDLWQFTVGDTGRMFLPLVNALMAAVGNLGYGVILADTAASLSQSMGFSVSRMHCLLIVTVVLILPLCLLKNLNVLSPFAVIGTSGILITAISMAIRLLDGSYSPGGKFYDDLEPSYIPQFGKVNGAWGFGILPFLCMSFQAYAMHYNAARLYTELKDTSPARFASVVGASFGFTAFVNISIAAIGFLTFGGNSDSYILNNYSPSDPLATLCRVMVAISTLTTYPISFIGFRDGILELLEITPERQTEPNLDLLSIILLALLTITDVFVTDLGMINAVGGGCLATVMVFIFPTLMFRNLVKELERGGDQREVTFAMVLMVGGTVMGVVGVYVSLFGNKW